jgi:hypothetical protein
VPAEDQAERKSGAAIAAVMQGGGRARYIYYRILSRS